MALSRSQYFATSIIKYGSYIENMQNFVYKLITN